MSRLIYACKFDVLGADAAEQIVQPCYQAWISHHYQRNVATQVSVDIAALTINGTLPDGHALIARRLSHGGSVVEMQWSFPSDDGGLIWRNLIRLAQIDDRCIVEHKVEISSSEYIVVPAKYSIGSPRVVRNICNQGVIIDGMEVGATVRTLSEDGVDQFVALLETDRRCLPIVLITPFANGTQNDLDAHSLAGRLAGVAIVSEADTPETTRLLSSHLGQLGCFDGGVRVYWPGFRMSDHLWRHPLMLGSRIATLTPERATRMIERSIFSIAAFRFVPDARIASIIHASEAASRAERAREVIGHGGTTWEQYALELSEELDAIREELEGIQAENYNLRANQNVIFSFNADTDEQIEGEVAQDEREPLSVREAVDFATEDCSNLLFLDSSRSSADDSPFRRPLEIYNDLSIMDKVASVWARNRGGGDLRSMLRSEGLGRRVSSFISQTTKAKWGGDYTFNYDGKMQLFEWHVTLGAGSAEMCASIHFLPDDKLGKLVVAHVGRHLPNTKS